jgi:hypothetical protein
VTGTASCDDSFKEKWDNVKENSQRLLLRSVYLTACVRRQWDDTWQPWYYIRPFVSLICGGISWLFLKARLLVLKASSHVDASELGFYGLGFNAGLNVDKFIAKVENIGQAAWGIEKSRASRAIEESPTDKNISIRAHDARS